MAVPEVAVDVTELTEPPRGTGLRVDPRTKLGLMFLLNILLLSGWTPAHAEWVRPVLLATPVALLVTARRYAMASRLAVALLACHVAAVLLVPLAGPLALLGSFGAMVERVLPVAALGAWVIATTRVSELVAGMQRLRLPRELVIPMTVLLRFIPTVVRQSRAIGEAMAMRGLTGWGHGPLRQLEYRWVPLMISITVIADELTASALARGLGGEIQRTSITRIGFGMADAVLALASGAVLAVAVLG
jgi:energy-coupling factor transporter transmembrane protein EcfT